MFEKIIVLFFILCYTFMLSSESKYIKQENMLVAKINIDTIPPTIQLISTQKIMVRELGETFFDIIFSFKVKDSKLKEENIEKIYIMIDDKENNEYEVIKKESQYNEKYYDIKIKKISTNHKIKVTIPEGIIIDKANNKNEEKIVETIL